jgi:hypothetical protein
MVVYRKQVKASRVEDWNPYEDGHLNVKIFYSGEYCCSKPYAIFSVWGADDIGMEIIEYVESDEEANCLISKWLKIWHEMPKQLSPKWLEERGFLPA